MIEQRDNADANRTPTEAFFARIFYGAIGLLMGWAASLMTEGGDHIFTPSEPLIFKSFGIVLFALSVAVGGKAAYSIRHSQTIKSD